MERVTDTVRAVVVVDVLVAVADGEDEVAVAPSAAEVDEDDACTTEEDSDEEEDWALTLILRADATEARRSFSAVSLAALGRNTSAGGSGDGIDGCADEEDDEEDDDDDDDVADEAEEDGSDDDDEDGVSDSDAAACSWVRHCAFSRFMVSRMAIGSRSASSLAAYAVRI